MSNANTQTGGDPVLQFQADNDVLLERVTEQITLHSFDADDQDTLKRLVDGFADPRGMVRLSIAETLGQIGEAATPVLLSGLLHDPNPVVRRACAKTLTLIGDPTAVPDLVHALLHDEDTVVQGSAIGALAHTGEAAVPPLLEILASPDRPESMKGHAAWALAFIGAEAKHLVYRELNSPSPEVRAAVVGVMAKVAQEQSDPQAFELLINALDDPDSIVRCEAAAVLGNLAHPPALPALCRSLHHPDWETRKTAALALMKLGDRAALAPLQTALAQESQTAVQTVINLAINQLQRQSQPH